MHNLEVHRSQVDYLGLLAQPSFSLWGEGKILLASLYAAYQPYGVRLADISTNQDLQTMADSEVSIQLGGRSVFRFKFDRVEARLSNYTEEDLQRFPDAISRGVNAIRQAASDFTLASHLLSHFSHSAITGVTSRDYLRGLAPQPDLRIGESRGHGFIFHYDTVDPAWQVQLTLDHSLSIPDGLFINYTVLIVAGEIDYQQTLVAARDLLEQSLAQLGLSARKSE